MGAIPKILRTGFERYVKKVNSQWEWWENEQFCQRIAVAVARMPLATSLKIDDHDGESINCESPDSICEWLISGTLILLGMLGPLECHEANRLELHHPPSDLLVKMLIAFHGAGISLVKLDIRSTPPKDYFALAPSNQDVRNLKAAMQGLKTLIFKPLEQYNFKPLEDYHAGDPEQESFSCVKRFVPFGFAILDSPSIEKISFDLSIFSWGYRIPDFNLFSLISFRPRPKLASLSLDNLAINLEELEKIMASCRGGPVLFSSHGMTLLDAKWADGLDLLRGKVSSESSLLYIRSGPYDRVTRDVEIEHIYIKEEIDDETGNEFSSDWYTIYPRISTYRKFGLRKPMLDYIKGYIDENPLRNEDMSDMKPRSFIIGF